MYVEKLVASRSPLFSVCFLQLKGSMLGENGGSLLRHVFLREDNQWEGVLCLCGGSGLTSLSNSE